MHLFLPSSSGGGAGGGGSLLGYTDTNAPIEEVVEGMLVLTFEDNLGQDYYYNFQVPDGYQAGTQITLKAKFFPKTVPNVSETMLFQATTTLLQDGDEPDDTTNQHSSTNSGVAASGLNPTIFNLEMDLTDASGEINSVAVSANDTLKIQITRGTDTAANDLCLIKGSVFLDLS